MAAPQVPQGLAGQLQDSEGVGEPTRFGPVEGQVGRSQLPDAPEALKDRRIHQVNREGFCGLLPGEADRPVEWIVISAGAHPAWICSAS